MSRYGAGIVAFVVALGLATDARAGLYHPDTIAAFDIDQDGNAIVPDIDSFLTMLNLVKKADNPESEAFRTLSRSIRQREQKGALTPAEQVALATDLLRLRNYPSGIKTALNLLFPLKRQAPENLEFLVYSLLAEAHLRERNPQEAYDHAYSALKDYPFPKQLLGMSPGQLNWYRQLEADYYLPMLRHRADESRTSKGRQIDTLDSLFPPRNRDKSKEIRFVGESGHFEVGTIAAQEKAKLPPDAIAIVQQLILWNPNDGRLWWLLAELYNAAGDVQAAERAYKVCKEDEVKFTPSVMLERAHQVADAAAVLRGLEAALLDAIASEGDALLRQDEAQRRRKELWVMALVATVLMVVIHWQVREVLRRMRRRRERLALMIDRRADA